MKHSTALALTIAAMTVVCGNALTVSAADSSAASVESPADTEEKEILFRGVPWGSSIKETATLLPELDLGGFAPDDTPTYTLYDLHSSFEKNETLENAGTGISSLFLARNTVEVAGYTPESVHLYFACVPDDDHKLTGDYRENTALYGAYYKFEPSSLNAMSEDLLEKLTSLYGEPDKSETEDSRLKFHDELYYWEGSDDTRLILSVSDTSKVTAFSGLKDSIKILYVDTKGDDLLLDALNAKTGGAANTDGL